MLVLTQILRMPMATTSDILINKFNARPIRRWKFYFDQNEKLLWLIDHK